MISPRELKFRIWDGNTFVSSPNYLIESDDGSVWHNQYDTYNDRLVQENFIVQQSTELKDKFGRTIYEGDVLKVQGGDWFELNPYFYTTIVVFNAGGFKCKTSRALESAEHDKFIGTDLFFHVNEGCEIIGNIFENKELLEN